MLVGYILKNIVSNADLFLKYGKLERIRKMGLEEKSIFVICPVREATEEEKKFIEDYVSMKEKEGYKVHYPKRDTDQTDPIGLRICRDNRNAIRDANEIHIYWNGKSKGSLFDIGMSFMAEKPIVLFNRDQVKKTPTKSFENVLLELDSQHNS